MALSRDQIVKVVSRYRGIVDEWEAFLEALLRPLPRVVWHNPLKIDASRFESILREEGIPFSRIGWTPGAYRLHREIDLNRAWWYRAGLAHAQEEASLLPVKLLDPKPGERILDLCAAPGGKTAQIAVALENRHTVVANDVHWQRLRSLRANLERLGLLNVSITLQDGSTYPDAAGPFDRVLADVPCSCEGTLRRVNSQLPFGEEISRSYAQKQLAILKRAVALCRPGGRIVYATCTFAPEENEWVVSQLLKSSGRDLRLLPIAVPGLRLSPALPSWRGERFHPEIEKAVRLWPHQNDTGGFFVALLEKSPEAAAPRSGTALLREIPAPEVARWLLEWHAIPPHALSGIIPHRRTGRGLHFAPVDHRPPKRPKPELLGLILLRTTTRPPKISTEGASLLGHLATRQLVDLKEGQLAPYLGRETFPLAEEQWRELEEGYVIVRYRGFGLGTGRFRKADRRLCSLFPKEG